MANASENERDRPMQGQSPFIVNAGLFYQNDSIGLNAGLMYNVIGKRIAFIGNAVDPHTWEMSRHLLDFNISKKIGKWFTIKASVNDILNQKVIFKQIEEFERDTNGDGINDETVKRDQNTRVYRPGTYFTLGFGLQF
jgi:outer membrane receptor protein involved in Fe transport